MHCLVYLLHLLLRLQYHSGRPNGDDNRLNFLLGPDHGAGLAKWPRAACASFHPAHPSAVIISGGRNLSRETWEWEGTVNARPGRARLTSAMSVGDRVGEGGRIVPHITNIISHPPRLQGPRHEFRAGLWGTIRSRGCELQTREGATPPRARWRCRRTN